ncbi:hypothetical protein C922_05213 [Plasmodium inui San Antonio 1]|uniref:Uncharacterized protein n=1 Tax=Plasmodium inui San Antonio 1 TaxID=1237626 RepID=W7A5P6_9APIC|nr:hypothetical protein C922_05213 [Plasmodium inui San Antonio 1]EUD64414.1 hypothetical protein C922_05213 [Plasmodium inui San Antonio 1]
MSNLLSFSKYITSIRDKFAKGKGCPNTNDLKRTLCLINTAGQGQGIQGKMEASILTEGEREGLEQVLKRSRSICLGLEVWAANLDVQSTGNKYLLTEKDCKANDTGHGVGSGGAKGRCDTRDTSLKWTNWKDTFPSRWNTEDERSFRACVDIVEMIIAAFRIKAGSASTTGTGTLEKGGCAKLSKMLSKWSDETVSDLIMQGWFNDGVRGAWEWNQYKMSGKDFFDIVQELIYGDNQGHRDIGCRKKGEEQKDLSDCDGPWCYVDLQGSREIEENNGGHQGPNRCPQAADCGLQSTIVKSSQETQEGTCTAGGETECPNNAISMEEGSLESGNPAGEAGKTFGNSTSNENSSEASAVLGPVGSVLGVVLAMASGYGIYRIFLRNRRRRNRRRSNRGVMSEDTAGSQGAFARSLKFGALV